VSLEHHAANKVPITELKFEPKNHEKIKSGELKIDFKRISDLK
jgi:hypothetical protein